jgi:hypothetical protein
MGSEPREATGLANRAVAEPQRRRCLAPGCDCMDRRILSPRLARFHTYLAGARGETADRVIAPDPEWRLPSVTNRET